MDHTSFKEEIDLDELFEEAARYVIDTQKASASLLQRQLSIGYARAARLLDQLEKTGVVTAGEGARPRDVLLKDIGKLGREYLQPKPARTVLSDPPEQVWRKVGPKQIDDPVLRTFAQVKTADTGHEIILGMIRDRILSRSLVQMRHLLIVGPANPSRTDILRSLVLSLLVTQSPDVVKFILCNHSGNAFDRFNGFPHLVTPVIIDPEKTLNALHWALSEMESRFKLFREVGVRNIEAYNELSDFSAMSRIVIVINGSGHYYDDELRPALTRIVEEGSPAGFHLIFSVTNDDRKSLPPDLSNNFSNRIYFKSTSLTRDDTFDTALVDSLKSERDAFFVDLFSAPVVFRVAEIDQAAANKLLPLMC